MRYLLTNGCPAYHALREIHVELEDLNAEAIRLAATIKKNFEELGV
jgi:type I restriction enzyme M protein